MTRAMDKGEDDLETYAMIASELARGADRAALLAAHGLDEEGFEALTERAEAELSSGDEGDGIPGPILRFDGVLRAASERSTVAPPSLEVFAKAFMIAQEGGRVHERLEEHGLSVEILLRGSAHYTPRFARDPELARRFKVLCSRSGRPGSGD